MGFLSEKAQVREEQPGFLTPFYPVTYFGETCKDLRPPPHTKSPAQVSPEVEKLWRTG